MTFSRETERYLSELAPWSDIAGAALACLSSSSFSGPFDEIRLCDEAGLPATQVVSLVSFLKKLHELGLVQERNDLRWQITAPAEAFKELSPLLGAIAFYRQSIHRDETTAKIVLTRPGQPSNLEEALKNLGFATGRLEVTSEAFGDIAASARRRFVVMTPFLDMHGANWLSKLLGNVNVGVKTTLIIRNLTTPSQPSYPEGCAALREILMASDTVVLDYAVPRAIGSGIETFHAKVVLADDDYAYVGSANMNRSSLETSMELGVLVRGEAARAIARVVDAIRIVCTPLQQGN